MESKLLNGKATAKKSGSAETDASPSFPKLFNPLEAKGVFRYYHISCKAADGVLVSNRYNLILTHTMVSLYIMWRIYVVIYLHTVNSDSELIDIDRKNEYDYYSHVNYYN